MQRSLVSGVIALGLLLVSSLSAVAQSAPCPIVNASVVSTGLGTPVTDTTQPPFTTAVDICDFLDAAGNEINVYRESNVFAPGQGGTAALALRYIPQLTDEMRAQLEALKQADINIPIPGYQVSTVNGLGDAAILIKSELVPGISVDTLIVQRGSDTLSFNMDDAPDAQAKLTSLAQAVLANLSP
jgi:hypothetical protein